MAEKQEQVLFKLLHKLYKEAKSFNKEASKYFDYYLGNFNNQTYNNIENCCNVIKPIVDTKTTLILDAMMEANVVPSKLSFASLSELKDVQDIGDILNDCTDNVKKINRFDQKKQRIVRDGLITGFIPVEITWNPDSGDIGDVELTVIDPRNIKWEKSAKDIADSPYVFIDIDSSIYDLKKKYATDELGNYDKDMCDKIDKLAGIKSADILQDKSKPVGVVTTFNDSGAQQAYAYESKGIENAGKSVKLIKCYIKDDSVTAPDESDDSATEDGKTFLKYKFPNGRIIIFAGDEENELIFEDKPIEYEFGIPLEIFNPIDLDNICGKGEVDGLIYVQDRINRAYNRRQILVGKYISTLCYDAKQLDLGEGDFINNFALAIENMKTNGVPEVVTNNTLGEIVNLTNYINELKKDAKDIARVNDLMISGALPSGSVKSGQMVDALLEAPQSSIRELQRQFRAFLINVNNKIISLVQQFYNQPRIIRISEGKKFASIEKDANGQTSISVYDSESLYSDKALKAEKNLRDFSITTYECEIVAGTEQPRTKNESTQLVQREFENGTFGDKSNPKLLEQYLRYIDFPNYRAFMEIVKENAENQAKIPPVEPPTKDLSVAFRDLPEESQIEWLMNNGFPKSGERLAQAIEAVTPVMQNN